ncbi:Transmembrane protein 135 like protein [Argiope bruennichi]|uniref:Transmembrane protein 135 like protein n=1 Tax=Argiope bruennichi TaxID=94029 RepID=A0A8T0ELW7_ARGBR|nr:Transmembrane protein 135 like protein [Argiope bruennichi]
MAVLSKFTEISIPYNCYETGHTWHPDCNAAALITGAGVFRESLKIYFPLYVISLFLRGKFSLRACLNVLENTLVSSAFLGFHGFGFIFFFCLVRKLLGRFYYLSFFFISSFITCFLGIFIERKNSASYSDKTDYAKHECVMMAINLYVAKKYGYSGDDISNILKFILGNNEAKQKSETHEEEKKLRTEKYDILQKAVLCGMRFKEKVRNSFFEKMSMLRHPSCPHDDGCIFYCLQGFCRPFLIGYAALSISRCFSFGKKLISDPSLLFPLLTSKRNLSLGLFLGGFGATFRIINCLLRWYFAKDHASYAIPAALLGGLFMKFFPSSTISLYLMWKTIEKGYLQGMEKGALPHFTCFTPLLYAFSSALLFHVAVMEAHNLKPAYFKFLRNVTQNRMFRINHHVLDIFGTQSSKLFSDSWPVLDYRYTSRQFQENILLWLIH